MRVQLLRGTAPLKFGKAKNMKNLLRFRSTFDFDRKYLCCRYGTIDKANGVINHYPSRVEQKNGELLSTNHEAVFAHFDLTKMAF